VFSPLVAALTLAGALMVALTACRRGPRSADPYAPLPADDRGDRGDLALTPLAPGLSDADRSDADSDPRPRTASLAAAHTPAAHTPAALRDEALVHADPRSPHLPPAVHAVYGFAACAVPLARLLTTIVARDGGRRMQAVATALLAPALLCLPFAAGFAWAQATGADANRRLRSAVQLAAAALLAYALTERWAAPLGLDHATLFARVYWSPHNDIAWLVTGPLLAHLLAARAGPALYAAAPCIAAAALLLAPGLSRPAFFVLGWALALWLAAPRDTAYGRAARAVIHCADLGRGAALAHRAGITVILAAQALAGVLALQHKPFLSVRYPPLPAPIRLYLAGAQGQAVAALLALALMAILYLHCGSAAPGQAPRLFAGPLGALVLPLVLVLPLGVAAADTALGGTGTATTLATGVCGAAAVAAGVWGLGHVPLLKYVLCLRENGTSVLCTHRCRE
jgi:hypothetical protein